MKRRIDIIISDQPCTGVTVSDVAVPDVVEAPCAARVNAAVRNLFALDNFAVDFTNLSKKSETRERLLTPTLGFSETSPNFTRSDANHTEALCLVECTNLLLSLPECHTVLEFAQLGLSVRFLGFTRAETETSRQAMKGK